MTQFEKELDEVVVAFPIHALPEVVRDMVLDCARVTKVPQGLPAACCLAVASAAIGSRLRVRSFHGKLSSANIMVLGAAETGSGKSEVYRVCVEPYDTCCQIEIERWEAEVLPEARAEKRLLEREIKNLETKATPANRDETKRQIADKEARLAIALAQMQPPVYKASDFTTQALIRLLCRMDGQMFCATPDAKNFVDMVLGRYNEGGTDEEVYLKGFSLEPLDRHRVGDGSQETPETCIVGLWLTQPDKLERLLAERALSEGGLLPRILPLLLHCPPFRVSMTEAGIDATVRERYGDMIKALFRILRLGTEMIVIDADEDARQALVDYHNGIADRREVELRDITGFAARWGEYAWRLALVYRFNKILTY